MGFEGWTVLWIALAAAAAVGEIATAGFLLGPFVLGAALAAVLAGLGFDPGVQLLAFACGSAAAFLAIRPVVRRLGTDDGPTGVGADRLVGRRATVVADILSGEPGLVRLDGEEWRAESRGGVALRRGTAVTVEAVEGTHVVVSRNAVRGTDQP